MNGRNSFLFKPPPIRGRTAQNGSKGRQNIRSLLEEPTEQALIEYHHIGDITDIHFIKRKHCEPGGRLANSVIDRCG